MDCIEFTRLISDNNTEELRSLSEEYFDATMVLYNIIGDFSEPKNITRVKSNSIASYSILYKSKKEATKISNAVNTRTTTLYNSDYIVNSNCEGCTITIDINKK